MGKVKKIAIHNTVYTLEGDEASIIANHAIPNTWHTSGTMVQLISDINNDETATEGKSYTGTVSLSDLPASMAQAEMKVEITKGSTSGNKIILFTITSENTAPYHWERVSAYSRAGYWREFMPNKNIDSTPTNGSNNLVTSDGVYDAVSTKVTGTGIKNIVKLTKTEYDALVVKDASTIYWVETPGDATFGGLTIAPAPLYYGANGFEIKDNDWNHNSYNDKYGLVEGSYHFNFVDLGSYFDSDGASFDENSGSIDNANTISYGGKTDWRLPTKDELASLITTDPLVRPGSTVNGRANSHMTIAYAGKWGLLIFPDNKTITGAELTDIDNLARSSNNSLGAQGVNNYLNQGCIFLPCCGYYNPDGGNWKWGGGDTMSVYGSATEYNTTNKYCLSTQRANGTADILNSAKTWTTAVRLVSDTILLDQYKLYLGNILIADSSLPSDIASILATI